MRALLLALPLAATACHHPGDELCRHQVPCGGGIALCVQPERTTGRTTSPAAVSAPGPAAPDIVPAYRTVQATLAEGDEVLVATPGDLGWYRDGVPLRHIELPPLEVEALSAADVDGDGAREILIGTADTLTIADDSGVWLSAPWQPDCALVADDADCDGDLDVIARCPAGAQVYLRAPDGRFDPWSNPVEWAVLR